MSDANKQVVRRLIEEVVSGGNIDALDEIAAENLVDNDPGRPPGIPQGREGQKALVAGYRAAFPDLKMTVEDQIAEGDKVVTRWIARGTHNGDLMGIPATGREATVSGIFIDRIANGQIAESWANWDQLGMLQQIGVVPEPEASPA